MQQKSNPFTIKYLTTVAMLCAFAYAAVFFVRVPAVLFLKYEPKDVIITLGGFIFGPMTSLIISVIASLLEMITFSETGFIGLIMNVLSSCAFACTASYLYKKKRGPVGALIGLGAGIAAVTTIMILWNYLISPLYMAVPRAEIIKMLIPVFLPFNVIKASLNSALVMLLYKPLFPALRSMNILPEGLSEEKTKGGLGIILLALFVLATCILILLSLQGII